MYEQILLNLSSKQVKALIAGKNVNVKSTDVGVGKPVYLSKMKINRLKKKSAAGKGTRLSLSNQELSYNKQQGGSIFSDIANVGKQILKSPVGQMLGNVAGDEMKNALDSATVLAQSMSPENQFLAGILDMSLKAGNSLGKDQIDSLRKNLTGRGFFSDVMGGISDVVGVGNKILDNPMAQALLLKMMTGGNVNGNGIVMAKEVKKTRGRPKKVIPAKNIFAEGGAIGNSGTFLEDLHKQAGAAMDYSMANPFLKKGSGIYAPGYGK